MPQILFWCSLIPSASKTIFEWCSVQEACIISKTHEERVRNCCRSWENPNEYSSSLSPHWLPSGIAPFPILRSRPSSYQRCLQPPVPNGLAGLQEENCPRYCACSGPYRSLSLADCEYLSISSGGDSDSVEICLYSDSTFGEILINQKPVFPQQEKNRRESGHITQK